MERSQTMSLGDVMRLAIEESEMSRRLDESKAVMAWPLVVGARLASKSPRPTVARGVMTIRIANAALRQELSMNRSRLTAAVNKVAGKQIISDIRFIS